MEQTEQALRQTIVQRTSLRSQVLKRGSLASRLLAVYTSQWFEMCLAILIIANSISIGVFTDWSLQNIDAPAPWWFYITNIFFVVFFSLEIATRCFAEGTRFANPRSKHFGWNMFDTILIVVELIEELLGALDGFAFSMSFLRLARLLRLVRVVRLLRLLRFFKELRLMAYGIVQCSKPLAWSSLLLAILSYIFVVFLKQVVAIWVDDNFSDPVLAQEATDRALIHFPSLSWGMYTLFKSISGGLDWGEVSDGLGEISSILSFAFCIYIVVGVFCVCNVITSIFLEAMHTKNSDQEATVFEHIQKQQEWMQEAKAFMDELVEKDGLDIASESGEPLISWAAFEALVELPRTKAFFQDQGLDLYFEMPRAVFELIDLDRNGFIDLNEFIVGLHRLRGDARALDMHLEMRQAMRRIDKLRELCVENHQILQALGSRLEISGGSCEAAPKEVFRALGSKFQISCGSCEAAPEESQLLAEPAKLDEPTWIRNMSSITSADSGVTRL